MDEDGGRGPPPVVPGEYEDLEEEEEEEEQGDTYKRFITWWTNEIYAPGILPYKADMVEDLTQELNTQTERRNKTQTTPGGVNLAPLLEHDCERLRYVLTDYHRIRALKIQSFGRYVGLSPTVKSYLSKEERDMLQAFLEAEDQYFRKSLAAMPEVLKSTDRVWVRETPQDSHGEREGDSNPIQEEMEAGETNVTSMIRKPDMSTQVIVEVLEQCEFETDETMKDTLSAGDRLMMPYYKALQFLLDEKFKLV